MSTISRSTWFGSTAAVFSLLSILFACSSAKAEVVCLDSDAVRGACGKIKVCSVAEDKKGCTSTYYQLPDGKKFTCATCEDCKKAVEETKAACGPLDGTPSGGTPPEGQADAAKPDEKGDGVEPGTTGDDAGS